ERWGESGVAVVVPRNREEFNAADLIAFCQDNLARYKIPKRAVLWDELPRNAAGKVLKRLLRDEIV
ncbi:MAG: hypothetical protein RI637_13110, partial [Acidimicrobiia bacterium]|nr:hypothetical protein [Acidimicrobiia bacterium]